MIFLPILLSAIVIIEPVPMKLGNSPNGYQLVLIPHRIMYQMQHQLIFQTRNQLSIRDWGKI
jgi:hypothetical protein